MTGNIKESPSHDFDEIKQAIVELYAVAHEEEPDRLANEDLKRILELAARRMLADEQDQGKRIDLETELIGLDDYNDVVDFIVRNFDKDTSSKMVDDSIQIILGRWINTSFPQMNEGQFSQVSQIMSRLEEKLNK